MSPSENCCFKRSTAQWCRDGACRFAETYFIVYNFTNWLLDMHQSCTDQCKCWGVGGVQAFSPSTLKCIQLRKKKKRKVHIVPTTVCSGCHGPLPGNQEKLMCFTLSHLHLVPRHSSHRSSILYLVDLCRSPLFF